MSDTGPYGYLQNATDQGVTADALVGERAGNVTAHQANPVYAPARFSTAPYKPDKPATLVEVLICRFKNCRQETPDGSDYCDRHHP